MTGQARVRITINATLSLALVGCPRGSTAPPETTEAGAAKADPSADSGAAPERQCGVDLRFVDYAWVPDDARLATSILRDDPELPAALDTLARMSDDPQEQLPVFAALDFRNLGLQLGNLDRLLAELGQQPAELVELHGPGGELVWLWPTDCPPARVAARALDRFDLMLRADLEYPGLRRGEGSVEGLPFDIVTFGEQRVALTSIGRGREVGVWLHASARGGDDGPGRLLHEIPAAPIRSVLNGDALLANPSDAPTPAARHRTIRVAGDRVTGAE